MIVVCAPGLDSVKEPRANPSALPAALVDPLTDVLCGLNTIFEGDPAIVPVVV